MSLLSTDPIADMLTRIRNGQKSKLLSVSMPLSKLKLAVLNVLKAEGFIADFKGQADTRSIEVSLKYSRLGDPGIREIHKVSKPGRRVYSGPSSLKEYYNNMGIYILSTSKGVISDREARKLNVGGEVICKVF
mgnify:CR=1 FL=1